MGVQIRQQSLVRSCNMLCPGHLSEDWRVAIAPRISRSQGGEKSASTTVWYGIAQLMPTVTSAAGEMLHARDTPVSWIDADATRRLVTVGACLCLTAAIAAAHQSYN